MTAKPSWMHNIVRSPEPTDAEHLALALEFYDAEVGREYLREVGLSDLLPEFERLREEV